MFGAIVCLTIPLAFGAIGTYFNELEKTSWIATAYLLTVSSFQYA
jgi:predicted phosphoribosyltransferase